MKMGTHTICASADQPMPEKFASKSNLTPDAGTIFDFRFMRSVRPREIQDSW
jgi:hypothetical protein